jgi:glycosyltransferase involved in cell wall biosynthesis
VKLAVVVQRYGAEISGGAELHARYIAEHLAPHSQVDVLTTCARDYVSWKNEFPAGATEINGIAVHRFPVTRERDVRDFARRSTRVFDHVHSVHDELRWLDSEGPRCPALIEHLHRTREQYDFVLLFSARYYQAFHGAWAAAGRAILVPTAEREPSLGLSIFRSMFRGVRAIMYNSPEERALITGIADNHDVPGVVVGVGSEVPASAEPERARQKFGLTNPYAIYVGRIDANKGCAEMFDHFLEYLTRYERTVDLVLIGTPHLRIPAHPRIRHLGFVTDADKFDAIAGASVLVMPSYYESLSMVALEAWALGRPVLANARCDVLLGQCLRSNAGLYYENAREFGAALARLLDDAPVAAALGANGRAFYAANYAWPVIERKYLDMFERLAADTRLSPMAPLPGFWARRAKTASAAAAVVDRAPSGAAMSDATSGALP